MPPRIPFDVESGFNTLRVTKYLTPHVSSYYILPCIFEMLSAAFYAVKKEEYQHPKLENHEYTCEKNNFGFKIVGTQVTSPLEYEDLVVLAEAILQFQQKYTMPGIKFDFLYDGEIIGQGYAWMQYAASNGTLGLNEG